MNAFWKYTKSNILDINLSDVDRDLPILFDLLSQNLDYKQHSLKLSSSMHIMLKMDELLKAIDSDLSFAITARKINLPVLNNKPTVIMRFNLEISAGNHPDKFDIVKKVVNSAPKLSDDFVVVSFNPPAQNQHEYIFIPFPSTNGNNRMIGLNSFHYTIEKKPDGNINLTMILDNDLVQYINTQEDIDLISQSIRSWIEFVFGEYDAAKITGLNILPDYEWYLMCEKYPIMSNIRLKNGVYLIDELKSDEVCILCEFGKNNVKLILVDDSDLDKPDIKPNGYYCKYCNKLMDDYINRL